MPAQTNTISTPQNHPRSRWLQFVFTAVATLGLCSHVLANDRVVAVANPYANVDWENDGPYVGNFHTHTTQSDGSRTPAATIDDYHNRGYHALAITDHSNQTPLSHQTTFPWQDFDRDPLLLGMVDVEGNELSIGHHIVSLFTDYTSGASDIDTRLAGIGANGGIGYIAHPGRYSISAQSYADHYENHPHIFGQAIYNQGDRYPGDRAKWDAVLSITMPDRPVWGISEDDAHYPSHVARNRTYMFMPALTHTNVRASLMSGAFYATVSEQNDTPPSLTGVTVNEFAGTITLAAENFTSVRWISMGSEVATGLTIDLINTPGVERYVRAEFQGPEGRMYTNPFGVILAAPTMDIYEGHTLIAVDAVRVLVAPVGESVSHTYTVTNRNLTLDTLLLSGTPDAVIFEESGTTNHAGFTISSNITGDATELEPGNTANFTVMFQTSEPGAYTGTVHIANNDPNKNPYTFRVTAMVTSYTVSYAGNGNDGGDAPPPQTKHHGVPLALASNTGALVKDGYTLVGWNTQADGNGIHYAEGATYTDDADLTLYAQWNRPPVVGAGPDQTILLDVNAMWTPADIEAVAWFDASDASTITMDANNKVSQWLDRSGNDNHATRADTAAQPTYRASDTLVNNMPSIASSSASGSVGLDTPSMSARNVYVVAYYLDGAASTFSGYPTLFSGPGSYGEFRVMGDQNTVNFIGTANFNNEGTFKNGSTASSLNNVLPMPASVFTFKSSAARTQVYSLGYNSRTDGRTWHGGYSEIILTDGNEDFETQQKIEGYLAHKWGLEDHLPSDHPHKQAAPVGSSVTATLAGFANDPDGDTLTTIWTQQEGPTFMRFADASVTNTTARFIQEGTYTLRLTAADDFAQAYDQVVITVIDPTAGFVTLAYDGNQNTGGNAPTDTESPYELDTEVTVLGAGDLVKTGHTFSHWNTAANGAGTSYNPGDTFNIVIHTTLYAQWTANPYTVTLDQQEGTGGSATVEVTFGSAMPAATPPTREGYTFQGYYTDTHGGGTRYYTATMASARDWDLPSDNTLYAHWTITVYEVNFSPVSASGPESTSPVTVTVVLSPAYSETVTVEHRLASPAGTANPGVDYIYAPGTLVFEPGQTSKSFTFAVIGDHEAKPDRTIRFELGEISNATAGPDTIFTYTIEADTDKWFTVPFRDSFDEHAYGDLHGQLGWVAAGVVVQSEETRNDSAKAVSIAESSGFMRRTFTDAQTNVWTDVYYQPAFFDEEPGAPEPDATSFLVFNADGNPMLYNGPTLETHTDVSITAGTWVRVTIRSDYVAKTWDLYINGDAVAAGLGFYDADATGYTEFSLSGAGEGTVPVDDLQIILTDPFIDGKLPATVTLGDLEQVFTGTPREVSATTAPPGLTVIVTYDGSAIAPTDAGNYPVAATINDATYEGTASGTLQISIATPTVTTPPDTSEIVQGQTLGRVNLIGGAATGVMSEPLHGMFSFVEPGAVVHLSGDYPAAFVPHSANYVSVTNDVPVTAHPPTVATSERATPLSWYEQMGLMPADETVRTFVQLDEVDSDGNGMANWQEYLAGTNPLDSNSTFRVLGVMLDSEGNVIVNWYGGTNGPVRPYVIQTAGSLSGDTIPWIALENEAPRVEGTNTWQGTAAELGAMQFFRIRATPDEAP